MNDLSGHEPVAVIGMAGRFPGAADLDRFWAGLRDGVEAVRFPSDEELLAAGVAPEALADPHYVKATALAPEVDAFDAEFFGLTADQARLADPQLRLFCECAHAALEDAGYDVERICDVGVFGATGANRYLELVRHAADVDPAVASAPSTAAWNSPDHLAPLVSRTLGLRGPGLGVLAAGAGSLVAVHLAAAALRAGECEVALAGGVEVRLPLGHGYRWEPGGGLSRDGRCRPFDIAASGTVPSSGVGVVALKRLSDALADRDHVRAVLLATAVDHGGVAAIATALSRAGVAAHEVAMVAAHADGTALDRVEVAALAAAFDRTGRAGPAGCALTSVQGNVGDLGHAAGVASLITAALALERESIPGTAGHRTPHPGLRLDGSPFHVPTRAVPWPRRDGAPRVAMVTALGAAGTNAHAVLREAPAAAPVAAPDRPRVVVWSARTPAAAEDYRDRLAGHFAAAAGAFPARVATLQRGRTAHPHRGAVVAADAAEAAALLASPDPAARLTSPAPDRDSNVVFLFPGLSTLPARVGESLYDASPAYAEAFDECVDLFEAAGLPLRRPWREGDEAVLHGSLVAQPLLFAVEYASYRAWRSWGVTPTAVVGHCLGEISAATAAGVFTLADAVGAVAARARAIHDLPPGAMLAVTAPVAAVAPFLTDEVRVALVNGPQQVTLGGPVGAVAEVGAALERAGLTCRRLPTPRAAHVPMIAPAVPLFEEALRGLRLAAPEIAFHSAALGGPAGAEATDPAFWSGQLVRPVAFADAVDALTAPAGRLLLVEVGPGRALTGLLRQHPTVVAGRHRVVPTLAQRRTEPLADLRSALAAVAAVWVDGHAVDWAAVEGAAATGRVPVPGYPYQRTRHWVTPAPAAARPDPVPPPRPAEAAVEASVEASVEAAMEVAVEIPRPATAAAVESSRPAPVATAPGAVAVVEPAAPPSAGPAAALTTADRLRGLWAAQLGRADVGSGADFFDLGGDSLAAVELMSRVRAEFGVTLGVVALFDHPTPAELAARIDAREGR